MENKSKKKPHTSATVKNRYNAKAYDKVILLVKKGYKDSIRQRAADKNISMNKYITDLVFADLGIEYK